MSADKFIAALALILGFTLAAQAATPLREIEQGVESSTAYTTLPSGFTRTWSITPCPGCESLKLRLDATSMAYNGQAQITFDALRLIIDALTAPRELNVFYDPDTNVVTRVVLGT